MFQSQSVRMEEIDVKIGPPDKRRGQHQIPNTASEDHFLLPHLYTNARLK